MINKGSYFTLLAVVLVLALAYLGVIGMLGFSKHWGTARTIAFYIITVISFYIPLFTCLFLYQRLQERDARVRAADRMK